MSQDPGDPRLIVYPARLVRTMDPSRPTARAVAVSRDRIRAVGSVEELTAYGPAQVDDRYADQVIFPGFVEAHAHMGTGAVWRFPYVGHDARTDPDGRTWPGCGALDEIIDRLSKAAATLANPGEPLTAWGFDPLFLTGERLSRSHLDAVSTTRAVSVTHQNGHLMTVNSVALAADGVTRDCSIDGVVKDGAGEPTGELRETAAMNLIRSAPSALDRCKQLRDPLMLHNFAADARNHGTTTLSDLSNDQLLVRGYPEWLHGVVDAEDFPARIAVFHLANAVDASAAVSRLRELREGNSSRLRFGYVKFILDGSIQGFTARLQDPGYLPDDRSGMWVVPPHRLPRLFQPYHDAGMLVHAHCNGDETTEVFLDTVERALEEHPRSDHRHTVTHSQLSTPAQYRRMAALGVCANIFSNHIWYWGDVHRDVVLGPDRAARMNAAATALRSGVPISLHCDSPITPLDPLATASHAAARLTQSGQVLGEHERISVAEALHAVTLGAAHMLRMDGEVGSIEAGKYADFAILEHDPMDVDPVGLQEIRVVGSVSGGRHHPASAQTRA